MVQNARADGTIIVFVSIFMMVKGARKNGERKTNKED